MAVWDEEMVIYQHQSGDTHLFSGIAKQMLAFCISLERFSTTDLIEFGIDDFNDRQQAEDFTGTLLKSLIQKDLIVAEIL